MASLLRRIVLILSYFVARPIGTLYHLSCSIDHSGPLIGYLKTGKPFLMTWWHQDMLFNYSYLVKWAGKRKIGTIASRSADGDFAAYLVEKHGMSVFRGSSSRGGHESLHQLMAFVKKEDGIGIIVSDGPRPPARVAKNGIVAMARDTGLPVIMLRSWADRQYIFKKSWPKLDFVFPFSKVILLSDGPVTVPKETKREGLEPYRLEIQGRLNRLAEQSEGHFV